MISLRKKSPARRKAFRVELQPIEAMPGGNNIVLVAVGLLTLAVLPHIGHLRFEVIAIFLVLAGYRCLSTRWEWLPRRKLVIYLFAAMGFSISAWFYGPPLGRDPGISFLIVMLGLKCVEMSTRRDVGIIVLLGFFTIVTHFLYADGISWAVPLTLLVAAFTWLLAQLEHATPRRYAFSDLKLVGKMLLQALPFVIILFYLFPRLSGSLFLFQADSSDGMTGLSESLRMGTISNLIQSEETAFTASFFDQPVPPPSERYWRGSNFWVTDGREWSRGGYGPHLIPKRRLVRPARQFQYEVELEANEQNWLFSLDYPLTPPKNTWLQADHQLISREPVNRTIRYTLDSVIFPGAPALDEFERKLATDIGQTIITPRLQALIDEFTRDARSATEVASNVLQHFNQNEFIYTLQPPLLASEAPVDEFMFESRRGFCGHYASSFATIMRSAGIPARIVVGYLGGEHNPRSNQIVVRQSDAHAWTEIWQQGRGWFRVDPTVAIAPERIESPIDFGGSFNSNGRVLFDSRDFSGLRQLLIEAGWIKDAIRAKWNRWFVTFDKSRQQQLLESLGLGNIDLRLVSVGAFLIALGLLTLISFALFRRDRKKIDPASRLYQQFCSKMAKLGVRRQANEGPRDFQRRAIQSLPHLADQITRVTDQVVAIRYSQGANQENASSSRQVRALRDAVKNLSRTRPA